MANKRVSELTTAGAIAGDELLPVVQSAASFKATVKEIVKFGYQSLLTDSTTAKTLALTDRGQWMRFTNAALVTLTVPPNSSVAFAIGECLNGIQGATGQVSIAAGAGVTINKPSGYNAKTRALGAAFCLIKIATDTWDLVGDLETV